MSRRRFHADHPVSYLGNIGILYLDAFPEEEAAALLSRRRSQVERFTQAFLADAEHQGDYQLML